MTPNSSRDPHTIPVRNDERLNLTRLEPWLRKHLPCSTEPLEVLQFGGGHANLTYLLRFGNQEYVLRRPPHGSVAASAHDMTREHRVLANLWQRYPLAPRSFVLCQDCDIIGSPFHVLERKTGTVIRANNVSTALGSTKLASAVSKALVDCLSEFHLVNPTEVGLADLGRPHEFLTRQLSGWLSRWDAAKDATTPDITMLRTWLVDRIPATTHHTLVHNDYKLDNVMFDLSDNNAVSTAVLDWDMCTLGDPLCDVGTMLNYWLEPDDPLEWRLTTTTPCDVPGFLSRNEALRRYADKTGFDLSHFHWYRVFCVFRSATILQQIYIRWRRGQTRDPRFSAFGDRVDAMIRKANTTMEVDDTNFSKRSAASA